MTKAAPGIALAVAMGGAAAGAGREVAITIDDLPRGGDGGGRTFARIRGMTERLLAPLRAQKIPATGFVHPGRTELAPPDLRRILELWLDAGAELGNHTWSHADLNRVPVAEYEQNILKADAVLRPLLEARGKQLEFFRYPMLHAGSSTETKRAIAEFLVAHGYRNAPVTFDNSDYMFAAIFTRPEFRARVTREYVPYLESVVAFFERRSVEVVGREFPQIMLLHASDLNSRKMPDILAMFRRRGYRFVSLAAALRDDAYRLPENYVGPGGFSWIHRWSMTKGMPNKGEPDEPEWVRQGFTRVRQLSSRGCCGLPCASIFFGRAKERRNSCGDALGAAGISKQRERRQTVRRHVVSADWAVPVESFRR
ncbi:MAG: polysaccharide deacetylase family protein [Bryobacteraceae bacterium]